jgi:hypothetical protein
MGTPLIANAVLEPIVPRLLPQHQPLFRNPHNGSSPIAHGFYS